MRGEPPRRARPRHAECSTEVSMAWARRRGCGERAPRHPSTAPRSRWRGHEGALEREEVGCARERVTVTRKKEVIPMKRKSYKIADVKGIRLPEVKASLSDSKRAVFGIDVAKSEVVVSIGGDDAESIVVFKVKQPAELPQLFEV